MIISIYANRERKNPVPSLIEGATTISRAEDELPYEARTWSNRCNKMIVYKITNKINNKIYIGITIRTLEERWKEHCYRRNERNTAISLAIRKYGIENFAIEVIDKSASTKEELYELEKYYIKLYNSNNKEIGYNLTDGGEGGPIAHFDEELAIQLYKQGIGTSTIAIQLGVSQNTIANRLRSRGIDINWCVDNNENNYIIEQYKIPRTVKSICKELNRSKDSVNRVLRLAGVKRHCFRESHENIKEIYDDYVSGCLTNEQICTKYNIHKTTMYKLIDYYKETYLDQKI